MKVVILCGGLGTRLKEETEFRPKPMVPVGGQPILWHIMKTYAHHGHKDFILCLGYKGEVIKEYFRNYLWNRSNVTLQLGRVPEVTFHNTHEEEDWKVTLLETGLKTQTAGRLRRAIPYVGDGDFLMTYGDGLTDCDINATIEFHRAHGKIGTLTAVKRAGRFGELAMDGNMVQSFQEKPEQEIGFINGGFMVLNRKIEPYLGGDMSILEQEPLGGLAREGQLQAYQHSGFWQCMDTYREQCILEDMWQSGQAPWKLW